MAELNDLSGPFDPNIRFDNFSKEFLIKLLNVWQWAWLQMDTAWFTQVEDRFGSPAAWECDLEMWLRVAEGCNPRYARIANIPMQNVVDSLKVLQLPLDNTMGGLFPVQYDIQNEYHAVVTVNRCPSLEACEKNAPDRIVPMCQVNEPAIIRKYIVNPKVQVTATKLPPRQGPDDIACQWEYKMEAPSGTRARGPEEVVDFSSGDKIPELDDLSGKFYPNMTQANLSKDFILKLIGAYQYAWLVMNGGYYDAVKKRFGSEAANDCELATWIRVGEKVNPRYVKLANVELNTVIDSLKVIQLPLDNTIGLFPCEYEIVNENQVYEIVTNCRTLDYLEKAEPERIYPMCHVLEKPVIERYLVNPKIKVTPVTLPPHDNRDKIACRWEFLMTDTPQWERTY